MTEIDVAAQLAAIHRDVQLRAASTAPDDGEVRILRGWLAAIERVMRPAE